LQLEDTII